MLPYEFKNFLNNGGALIAFICFIWAIIHIQPIIKKMKTVFAATEWIYCPDCDEKHYTKARYIGRSIICKNCGEHFTIEHDRLYVSSGSEPFSFTEYITLRAYS